MLTKTAATYIRGGNGDHPDEDHDSHDNDDGTDVYHGGIGKDGCDHRDDDILSAGHSRAMIYCISGLRGRKRMARAPYITKHVKLIQLSTTWYKTCYKNM